MATVDRSSSRMQRRDEGYESSSSGNSEFDFGTSRVVDEQAEAACSAADELFYNGKILPLELAPRMAAMGIQADQEQDSRFVEAEIAALLRRGRSMGRTSSSASGSGSSAEQQPCTRKSSSYPPCGNKSSSIFRDLFGVGGSSSSSTKSSSSSSLVHPQQHRQSKVFFSSSKGLLKRVFANWSSSTSSASVTSIQSLPASPTSSPARSISQLQQGGRKKASAPTRRKAGELGPTSVLETRSAPASPLSPHVRPRMNAGVGPILHLGGFKQQQQLSSPSYYPQQHRRKSILAA